jgi:hypothetical protein
MKTLTILIAASILALATFSAACTASFKYKKNLGPFDSLTYTGTQELRATGPAYDYDWTIKAYTQRTSFFFSRSMYSFFQASPALNITTAYLTGVCAEVAAGAINVTNVVYDMSTNLIFWTADATGETAIWYDGVMGVQELDSTVVTNTPAERKAAVTVNPPPGPDQPFIMNITTLVQYMAAHSSTPWGIVSTGLGGSAGGRVVLYAYENTDPAGNLSGIQIVTDNNNSVPCTWPGASELDEAGLAPGASGPLLACQPNPFSGRTVISFQLTSGRHRVSLSVYDIHGRQRYSAFNRIVNGGRHETTWAAGAAGNGVYAVRLTVDGKKYHQRVVVER